MSNKELDQIALECRRNMIKMSCLSGSGHITSSASCLEILLSLYFGIQRMNYDPHNPQWDGRDYIIMSKGHAAMGLYCVLSEAGYFPKDELWTFCSKGTRLGGHPSLKIPGVETASGSLGHGLSFAVGIALGMRLKGINNRVYVLVGDGELQEGTNWEAAMSLVRFGLDNVVWFIDKNNIQLSGFTDDIMPLGDLRGRLMAMGFEVSEINGHDYGEINAALSKQTSKPHAVIANTVKGYGYKSIENLPGWHGRKPSSDELAIILNDLGTTVEEMGI